MLSSTLQRTLSNRPMLQSRLSLSSTSNDDVHQQHRKRSASFGTSQNVDVNASSTPKAVGKKTAQRPGSAAPGGRVGGAATEELRQMQSEESKQRLVGSRHEESRQRPESAGRSEESRQRLERVAMQPEELKQRPGSARQPEEIKHRPGSAVQFKHPEEVKQRPGSALSDRVLAKSAVGTQSELPLEAKKTHFVLGDFEIGTLLGKGLYGHVYLARTKKEKRVVALKVCYKKQLEKEGVVEQLKREVEIHSRIKHPNVVKMYSYFHDDTRVYLVLEYVKGGTLFSALEKAPEKRFDELKAATVTKQLCSALAMCHQYQVVHRDIKPENILIGKDGEVKLADFGWSVANFSSEEKMRRKTMCGTIQFLPPEMINEQPYDERVDAWMVGVLLYEMLVGATPFEGDQFEAFDRISQCVFEIPDFIPAGAQSLIRALLVKNPDVRMLVGDVAYHPWIVEQTLQGRAAELV